MKYYLDEDLSPRVAEIARGRCGLDVVSAHDVGTKGWTDPDQLRYAAQEGRCVVTRNRDDFLELTWAAFDGLLPHAGVLVVTAALDNDRFTAIAAALCAHNARFPDGMPSYFVDYLSGGEA